MLWLLGVAAATARPAGKPPPCSLNGFGSPCVCDPGWTGENCGQLDLLPAPPLASQVTALSATTTKQIDKLTHELSVASAKLV